MKGFIIALFLIGGLLCGPAVIWASPFLVCDPQAGVDTYIVDTDGTVVTGIVFQDGWIQDGKLYFTDPGGVRTPVHVLMDEAILAVGAHTQKARACKAAIPPWYPEVCSANYSIPLAFTKPVPSVAPNAPMGLSIPQ